MDFYINIKILPDAEMPANRIMNTLFSKLHKTLFDKGSNTLGVSFPEYKIMLGNLLRLHGTKADLEALQQNNWIGGLSGYCKVSDSLPIPVDCKHRQLSRIQSSMSLSKLNRLVKRDSITDKEVQAYKVKMFSKGLDQPYLELVSSSNQNKHRRYINFGTIVNNPIKGEFDQFGLSKSATIPWF